MPNAWNAGLRWVAANSRLESCLRSSKATEPMSAPCHMARSGMCGRARTLKSTKNIRVVAAMATTTANTSTVHERSWLRPARSRTWEEKRVTTPDTATLTSRVDPTTAKVSRSRSLPTKKLGRRSLGSSKTTWSAVRMPDNQPSPA